MSFFSQIHFVNPELLALLLLLPLAAFFYYQRYRKYYPTLRLSSLVALEGIQSWRGRWRALLPVARALSFVCLIVAIARPQIMLKEDRINADSIDIMLVMDLSSSMLAQDFTPDRLEVSKNMAVAFVNKRPYDRIGLTVFAGEAFTQCPLTSDHRIVKEFLINLQCGMLEDGTAIGMGLATAVNRTKDSPSKSKVIILLTDGVNNTGYIKPITAAEIAREFGIKVYTIGVGTIGDALTPVSRRSDGRYIFGLARVEIDEPLMQQIAEMTGGRYFRATDAESLQQVYEQIDKLEKTKVEVTTIKRYSEEFYYFAGIALFLLILEFVFRYTIFRTIP